MIKHTHSVPFPSLTVEMRLRFRHAGLEGIWRAYIPQDISVDGGQLRVVNHETGDTRWVDVSLLTPIDPLTEEEAAFLAEAQIGGILRLP